MSEKAFNWDDTIQNDGGGFQVLPEGEYDFTVEKMERAWFSGSDKMGACPKAVLSIKVTGPAGATTVNHNFFLHSKAEGFLHAFFTAIGVGKPGEPLKMEWNRVPGARGRCKLGIRKWRGNDGIERESNEITRFLKPDAPAAHTYTPESW